MKTSVILYLHYPEIKKKHEQASFMYLIKWLNFEQSISKIILFPQYYCIILHVTTIPEWLKENTEWHTNNNDFVIDNNEL